MKPVLVSEKDISMVVAALNVMAMDFESVGKKEYAFTIRQLIDRFLEGKK